MKNGRHKYVSFAFLIVFYCSTQLSYCQYQSGLMCNFGIGQFAGNSKINKVPVAVGSGQFILNRPVSPRLALVTGLGYGAYGTKYRTKWSGPANGIIDLYYRQQTLFFPFGMKYLFDSSKKWFVHGNLLCHLLVKSRFMQNGKITDFENKRFTIDYKIKNYKNCQPYYGAAQLGFGREIIIDNFLLGWTAISFEQGISRVNRENDFYKEYQQAVQLHVGILFSSNSLK